jgi:pimeloyl-ACP methyl ester carboxylesterase
VVTPAGRGPDGFYAGYAEADTFEAWADVARHYKLDPSLVDVSGYSMGGFGTYRLLARYPDLFARGFSVVGAPGAVDGDLTSLRNTPLLAWNAQNDELVPITETEATVRELTAAGLRFVEDIFNTADHLTLATNDWYQPGAEFLGDHRVDRSPPRVTYVLDPAQDAPAAGVVADHAYWLSGLTPRNRAAKGTIDARSEPFGREDPAVLPVKTSAGTLNGGQHGQMPFISTEQDWGAAPLAPRADMLFVSAINVATATVDAGRARLNCSPTLVVHSDGPLDLRVVCPPPHTGRLPSCSSSVRLILPRVRGARIVEVVVMRRRRHLRGVHGRNLRSVAFHRVTRRAFSVRVYMFVRGRHVKLRRIVLIRTVPPCR